MIPASPEKFDQLAEGVYVWWGDLKAHEQTNVGVIVGERSTVVIDANFDWAAQRILHSIDVNGWGPVGHVVNTHYHVDHSMGNVVFAGAGATIVGAVGQRDELASNGQADSIVQTGSESSILLPPAMEFSGLLRFFSPTLDLMSVEPAHTGSDVIAWLPEPRVLFVGDLAVNWDHGNNLSDGSADIDGWIRVLDRCLDLQPALVVPAHGVRMTRDELREQRDFIAELWSWAKAGHRAGEGFDRFREAYPMFAAAEKHYAEMLGALAARFAASH